MSSSLPGRPAALGEPLLDRWLGDAAVLAPEAGRDLWLREGSLLLRGWGEPHRHYHTPQHLHEVLGALDEIEAAGELDADSALLARTIGWYHDLAYDPRAAPGSNEHRSATLARDHLHHLGVDPGLVDAVEAGVLMTLEHQLDDAAAAGHCAALAAFHDADLWILSAAPLRYAAYRDQVRAEYGHVPEPDFRAGRAAVMAPFAARDRLYRTEHAHREWTERARANLATELRELGHGG